MQSFEPSPHLLAIVRSSDLIPVRNFPVDQNPAAVYLASLAPGSRRTMRQALNSVAALLTGGRAKASNLDWSRLRYQHSQAVRATLAERLKPATVNKILAALRRVLKEAWRLGQMSAEDFHRAADIPTIRSDTLPRGRALSAGEIAALFRVCADGTRGGVRDAALLAVLYAGGLRRSEAVGLDLSDYQPDTGACGVGKEEKIASFMRRTERRMRSRIGSRSEEPNRERCSTQSTKATGSLPVE